MEHTLEPSTISEDIIRVPVTGSIPHVISLLSFSVHCFFFATCDALLRCLFGRSGRQYTLR